MGIFDEYFTPKLIGPLFDKLKTIRSDRKTELLKLGNIFGDAEELAKFYIEPNCQHANPANEDEDDPASIIASPVFATVNIFLNGDFAVKGDGRNILFVLADAGMGKTSLLMMLKLSHLMSFWPKKYKCELLKIGSDTIPKIREMESKSDTILLLDALDEDPMAYGAVKDRLVALINELHNFRRVILTCRTQFFPNDEIDPYKRIGKIKIGSYVCPMFFLSLFNDNHVEKYLDKRLDTSEEKIKAKKIIMDMGSLKFRPLLLAHIDGFMEANRDEWTEYTVFETLIDTWLMREEAKLKQQNSDLSHSDLIDACIAIARAMHTRGVRTIEESRLENLSAEDYPELTRIPQIDLGGRSLLNKNSDNEYRFSHYSIQEFLLAKGIVSRKIESPESVRFTDRIFDFIEMNNPDNIIYKEIIYEGANLSRRNLDGRDFSNIKLTGANFSKASLNGANFQKAIGSNASFEKASLVEANMSYSKFDHANFSSTTLDKAIMEYCDFNSSDFRNASIVNSELSFSDLTNGNIGQADLSFSKTTDLKINGLQSAGAIVKGTSIMTEVYQEWERLENENIIKT